MPEGFPRPVRGGGERVRGSLAASCCQGVSDDIACSASRRAVASPSTVVGSAGSGRVIDGSPGGSPEVSEDLGGVVEGEGRVVQDPRLIAGRAADGPEPVRAALGAVEATVTVEGGDPGVGFGQGDLRYGQRLGSVSGCPGWGDRAGRFTARSPLSLGRSAGHSDRACCLPARSCVAREVSGSLASGWRPRRSGGRPCARVTAARAVRTKCRYFGHWCTGGCRGRVSRCPAGRSVSRSVRSDGGHRGEATR